MTRKKSKRKQSRPDSLRELAARRPFIDGYDSYEDEYRRWKRMDIVRGLVGVFELSDEQSSRDTQDLLPELGLSGYEQLFYDSDVDNSVGMQDANPNVKGSGWTSTVRDNHGRVRPIVFIQQVANATADNVVKDEEEVESEIAGITRLLVLMHELGHAEDIARSINFDHDKLKLDIVNAEVYAHLFVLNKANSLGYRLALRYYIENVEEGLTSENDAVRQSAEKVLAKVDIETYKTAAKDRTDVEIRRAFAASGRMKELASLAEDSK